MSSIDDFTQDDFYNKAENIYEAVLIIAKRARHIGELQKRQIDRYLGQTEMLEQAARQRADDTEEVMEPELPERPDFNFEKPVVLSMQEMLDDCIESYYEE